MWRTWFLSDLSGALVVTPFILTWAAGGPVRFTGARSRRASRCCRDARAPRELPSQRDVPYIVFPVLIWAALRFGPRGASLSLLLASSLTVLNTAHNAGPFVRDSITDSLLSTQLFMATAALTSLVLAAVTAERSTAAGALRANEERLRSILRSMGEGLVVRDARGLITDGNARRADPRRRPRAASAAGGPRRCHAGHGRGRARRSPAERLLGDGARSGLVVRLERPDGTWSWLAASSSPVRDAAGRLTAS